MKNKKQTILRKHQRKLKEIRRQSWLDLDAMWMEFYNIQYHFAEFQAIGADDTISCTYNPTEIYEKNMEKNIGGIYNEQKEFNK